MIASLYPMEESETDVEKGFIDGSLVAVKVDAHNFVCGKSRIRIYDQYGIRRTYDRVDEKGKRTYERKRLFRKSGVQNNMERGLDEGAI